MQNEYHYKKKLESAIDKFINQITNEDNELGWIPDGLVMNMTEAAWLILKQNIESNKFIEQQTN